jgi:2-oxo-3-(phosphooxy)propyl 3-oxoalkanoate synthase
MSMVMQNYRNQGRSMPPSTERAVIDASIHRANIDAAPAVEQDAIRTLVHKRFPENVLLTDLRACADDRFICTGRIPTDHPVFNAGDRTPCGDILFYTEVGRQASLAVTHAFLGVALEDVFIFEGSQAAVTPAIWQSALESPSDSVEIEIKVREAVRRKNKSVTRVVAEHVMTVGHEHVFEGMGTWSIQSAALFKRLRRTSADAADAAALDRTSGVEQADLRRPYPPNVVISAPEYTHDRSAVSASLIVDRTHPYFFDHPCDHVPGMLLLEGCAQLSLGAFTEAGLAPSRRAVIIAYDIDFTQFVECSLPTLLTARVSADQVSGTTGLRLEIVVSQRDVVAGVARIRVGFPV